MKKIVKTYVVVVGHDHQNTLGVIRSLGEAGIGVKAVILSDRSNCSSTHSKYVDKAYIIRESELIQTLIEIGNQLGIRIPLIPCGDDSVMPIVENYDILNGLFILPYASNGSNVLHLMNKKNMLESARNAGLKVPNWVTIEQKNFCDIERLCAKLKFPCILKPLQLISDGTFEFRILDSMRALSESKDYIFRNCTSIIVQEYVNKTNEYGINGCRLYCSGKTVFGGVIEKKRFSQSSLGSTTAGTIFPDEYGLCEAVKQFVEYIDYRGIFDIEFITDGNEFYFVEINFRNGGYGYAYTKAGRNFPALWACEACGLNIEAYLAKPVRKIFFINESSDLQNVRAKNISVVTWIIDVLRADARMYINFRDMVPLLKKIIRK